jgi:NAD(P)-dependent dehydrogenase (short-subunit alcohol dehydrogenase family)
MGRGTVLVTGASTGIGEASARHLLGLGFDVVAGVRKDEDAERLRGLGARAVKLDVTDQASIDAVRAELGDEPFDTTDLVPHRPQALVEHDAV